MESKYMHAPRPPFSSFSLTHRPCPPLTWELMPETWEQETQAHPPSPTGARSTPCSLLPSLHTQGIKQESIQGTVPTACAGSRGKNNTTSLFLPKMKQESSSRALGAGETGLGHKADDEAPMWGTGRTPASLHVHTTGLCWASPATSASEKSFGGGWLAKPTRPL